MSSKRRLRRRSCTSKKRYDNAIDAQRDADDLRAKYGGIWLSYSCRFCSGYHVGRPSLKQKKARGIRFSRNFI